MKKVNILDWWILYTYKKNPGKPYCYCSVSIIFIFFYSITFSQQRNSRLWKYFQVLQKTKYVRKLHVIFWLSLSVPRYSGYIVFVYNFFSKVSKTELSNFQCRKIIFSRNARRISVCRHCGRHRKDTKKMNFSLFCF